MRIKLPAFCIAATLSFFLTYASILSGGMVIQKFSSAGGSQCTTAEHTPTSDGATTDWTTSAGTDHYALVDEGRAGDALATYIYNPQNDTLTEELVFDISTPGDCDIASVDVHFLCSTDNAADDFSVRIKAGAGSYTGAQTITCPTTIAEQTASFTSLSWSSPQSITVEIVNDAVTYNWAFVDAMTVEVNP